MTAPQRLAKPPASVSHNLGSVIEPGRSSCTTKPHDWVQSLSTYLNNDVAEDFLLEGELLMLAFATGMQDSTTFPDYHCFASNQTGNTVLLAVGAAGFGDKIFRLSSVGISLGTFVAGVWLFGQLGNVIGRRRRLWLLLSNIIQTSMVFAAATVQYRAGNTADGTTALAVIALLAFSSGCQVAMARELRIIEITTAMVTAAYVDLFIDEKLFSVWNRPRNRRFLFLLMLATGSFAGAVAYERMGSAFALFISAAGKLLVTVAFFFNAQQKEDLGRTAVNKALQADQGCQANLDSQMDKVDEACQIDMLYQVDRQIQVHKGY